MKSKTKLHNNTHTPKQTHNIHTYKFKQTPDQFTNGETKTQKSQPKKRLKLLQIPREIDRKKAREDTKQTHKLNRITWTHTNFSLTRTPTEKQTWWQMITYENNRKN